VRMVLGQGYRIFWTDTAQTDMFQNLSHGYPFQTSICTVDGYVTYGRLLTTSGTLKLSRKMENEKCSLWFLSSTEEVEFICNGSTSPRYLNKTRG